MQRIREKFNEVPPAAISAAWLVAVLLAGGVTWAAFSSWRAGETLRERALEVVELLDTEAPMAETSSTSRKSRKKVAAVTRTSERRFFSPAPPQGFRSAQGVLGDRVLYPNGDSYAVGDNVMGAVVKEIDLNHVELEYEGETIRVNFGSGGGSGGGSSGGAEEQLLRSQQRFRRGGRRSR